MAEEWFFVLGALGIAAAALILALLIRSGNTRKPQSTDGGDTGPVWVSADGGSDSGGGGDGGGGD